MSVASPGPAISTGLLVLALALGGRTASGQELAVGMRVGAEPVGALDWSGAGTGRPVYGGTFEVAFTPAMALELGVTHLGGNASRRSLVPNGSIPAPAPVERFEVSEASVWELPARLKYRLPISENRRVFLFGGVSARRIAIHSTTEVTAEGQPTSRSMMSIRGWGGGVIGGFGLELPAGPIRLQPDFQVSAWSRGPGSSSYPTLNRLGIRASLGIVVPVR